MRKIKFAIIGCGYISTKHIKAIIDNINKAELVSVCDIVKEKAELKAEEYIKIAKENNITARKPSVFQDYKAMLLNEDIKACSICTISGYRSMISLDCINLKKNVLVEKPMAMSLLDADKMIKAAEDSDVKLSVSYQIRFKPIVQKLKQTIEDGSLGKIVSCSARILRNRNKEYYDNAKWKGTWELDGGCLMNQCSHHIDLLQWFINTDIDHVYGQIENYVHPYIESEDYGNVIIRYKNKSIGHIEGTVNIYPMNFDESITIIGEKGTIAVGGLGLNKILKWDFVDTKDSLDSIQIKYEIENKKIIGKEHSLLYKNFIDSINKNMTPLIDGYEGKKSLEIILMAYQSQKENKPIKYQKDLKISTTDFIGMLDNN